MAKKPTLATHISNILPKDGDAIVNLQQAVSNNYLSSHMRVIAKLS